MLRLFCVRVCTSPLVVECVLFCFRAVDCCLLFGLYCSLCVVRCFVIIVYRLLLCVVSYGLSLLCVCLMCNVACCGVDDSFVVGVLFVGVCCVLCWLACCCLLRAALWLVLLVCDCLVM